MLINNIFNKIKLAIEENKFFLSDEKNINSYLDFRDSLSFDGNWSVADKELTKKIKSSKSDYSKYISTEAKLREEVFKMVIQKSNNFELAEYISDDSGLIYANVYFDHQNTFVNTLYEYYCNKQLPGLDTLKTV